MSNNSNNKIKLLTYLLLLVTPVKLEKSARDVSQNLTERNEDEVVSMTEYL